MACVASTVALVAVGGLLAGCGSPSSSSGGAASVAERTSSDSVPPMATPPHPFGLLSCVPQDGVRFCAGGFKAGSFDRRIPSFDGTPLDTDVTLPASGKAPYPLIVMLHGLGESKYAFEGTAPFDNEAMARRGFAVLTYTARGFGDSCGTMDSRTAACRHAGWIHLADQRFEIRDTQYLAGRLVDEGIARPGIAVTGVSYGGGQSLELAVLDNRERMSDGRLVAWTSPKYHVPMRVAATFAQWGWDDLVDALTPNGGLTWTGPVNPVADGQPAGVQKQHWLSLLYAVSAAFYLAAPGQDPTADLTTWNREVSAGEPYNPARTARLDMEFQRFKSAIGIPLPPGGPGPVMLQEGTTDSLFPVGQATQFAARLQAAHDHTPLLLELLDVGHSSHDKPGDITAIDDAAVSFFDDVMLRHVRPHTGVVARTTTCPTSAPSGGPITAMTPGGLATRTTTTHFAAPQTVRSGPTNPAVAVDVTNPTPWCATYAPLSTSTARTAGIALYPLGGTLRTATTVVGPARVRADLRVTGTYPELVGELWDVAPDGSRRIVQVGVVRPATNQAKGTTATSTGRASVDFELMPNFETVPAGHHLALTLSGSDVPYYRASNGTFTIDVGQAQLSVPFRTGS
jgi:dienelactone hydrolase